MQFIQVRLLRQTTGWWIDLRGKWKYPAQRTSHVLSSNNICFLLGSHFPPTLLPCYLSQFIAPLPPGKVIWLGTQACSIRVPQPFDHSDWLRDKHITQLATMWSNLCTSVKEACSPFLWIGGYWPRTPRSLLPCNGRAWIKGKSTQRTAEPREKD